MTRLLLMLGLLLAASPTAHAQLATLLDSTTLSPAYFLDLGNREFEAGRTGHAILAYERGLRLRPGQRELANNLAFVRGEAGLNEREPAGFFGLRWWRTAGAVIGATTAFVLAQVFWWLGVGLGLFWWVRRREMDEKRRFALLPLAVTAVGLAALFFALGNGRNAYLRDRSEAILLVDDSELRVAPDAASSLEDRLGAGVKLRIVDTFGNYTKVALPDGSQGWLPNDRFAII